MRIPTQEKLVNIFFLLILFVFINAFNFQDNPSGWYQQFLPSIGSRTITDITFLDSLTGYSVATQSSDTSYILKTTNGGDNWNIVYRNFFAMTQIQFLNSSTGFACGGYLYKTTNAGLNWNQVNTPAISAEHMHVLNQDTIWLTDQNGLVGGVFRTTNGGANWTQQLSLGNLNPVSIYFYNANTGFIAKNTGGTYVRRTTDGGANWSVVVSGEGFTDMYFIDSLTGWRSFGTMKKTTNGGLNWVNQPLPQGGVILTSQIIKFTKINKDTIWGGGSEAFYGAGQFRGILNRTTNGGTNWQYQIPDTSIHSGVYGKIDFRTQKTGWAYWANSGVHTTVGGDTTFLTKIEPISTQSPSQFKLEQNYPNPFNPVTNFKFQVSSSNYVSIKVFDLTGKEIAVLVNEKKNAGSYSVSFDASKYNLSSGIYFYSLYLDEVLRDTKKMILVK